ncbi:MAG: LD-carboxypeptidase [Candidatus Latescibacteria bacterium]|nr:LD-carboxypeptidase [Candidatus Latescibacterota bacterium]
MPLPLLKPHALRPGDTIGVIAPASRPTHPSSVKNGVRALERMGFTVKLGRHVMHRHGYLAGTDEERLADLEGMFIDGDIAGIICVRGGYGSARLLSRLDFDLIRSHPKVFVGYSDITSLQVAFLQQAGLVTFWGPMVASEIGTNLDDYTRDSLLRAISRTEPVGEIHNPPGTPPIQTITGGIARGRLIGGNLTLITATLGTPFEIDTDGAILFFEDVGEEPYRIDRMLTQLLLAGKLDRVAGVVIGECAGCESREFQPAFPYGNFSIEEVFDDLIGRLRVPAIYGLCIGHGRYKATLPVGVQATLDADRSVLSVDEAGVTE